MKAKQIFIFLILLISSSIIKFNLLELPFLTGKYIYWLFIIVITSLIFFLQNNNQKWYLNQFDICLAVIACISLWNFLYFSNAKIFNSKAWYFIGYIVLYIMLRKSLSQKVVIPYTLKRIHTFLLLTALLNAVIAILQKNQYLSSSNQYFQVTGLFFSPNHLALFINIGILSLTQLAKETKSSFNKILFSICFLIFCYTLYLSECRGAYAALTIAILFNLIHVKTGIQSFLTLKKMPYFIAITSCLFLLICNTNINKSESISGRVFIIKQSLTQLKEHFWTGYGFDSFSLQYNLTKATYFSVERPWDETRNAAYIYNVNNDFLELTFELGIIWIVVFCTLTIMLFFTNLKQNESIKTCKSIVLCILIFAFTNTILPVPVFLVLVCIFSVAIINETEMKPILAFKQKAGITGILTILIMLFSGIIIMRLNAEYHLKQTYNGKETFDLKKTEDYVSKIDANGEQLFMSGIIFLKNNYTKVGVDYLINGFNESGKPSLGKKLGKFFERTGNFEEAEKIYIYNQNTEPYRFEARMDLFELYLKTNQKEKAEKKAKEIFSLPEKIPYKKIDNFKQKAKYYLRSN